MGEPEGGQGDDMILNVLKVSDAYIIYYNFGFWIDC
jgi:hypothetical protein